MSKTLLLSDSANDIVHEVESRYSCLRILNLPLFIDGTQYWERDTITPDEYYEVLNRCTELPTHAALNIPDFVNAFLQAAEEGYGDVVYLSINGKGSSTYGVAVQAKKLFLEEHPEAAAKLNLHLVDGRCYSLGYGLPLIMAAEMIEQGKTALEVVHYLVDYIDYRAEYVCFGSLKFARRSGRIGAAAAFAGELLGIKPIMGFPNGDNTVHAKVRGEKAVVPKLFELYKNEISSEEEEFGILYGEDAGPMEELVALIKNYNGKSPKLIAKVGPCVATNAGPKIIGIIFRTKHKVGYDAPVL